MVPLEITVPSARLALASKVLEPDNRTYNAEVTEKRWRKSEEKWQAYHNQISQAYNKKVKPRVLKVGVLVLKTAGHIQKGLSSSKFASKWEGHNLVLEAYNSGY